MKITGTIIKGKGRGKDLGYPTANMSVDSHAPEGIFASTIVLEGTEYRGATFIGPAKTFGETDAYAETYIFDFDQEIYGKTVHITLHKKVRDNETFDTVQELVEQIHEDVAQVSAFFEKKDMKYTR